MNPISFSIITPTFNGSETLGRLFDSLVSQNVLSLEWIIVDDASTFQIGELVESFRVTSPFPIIYRRISKGHKKAAVNQGVLLASHDFSCVIDDDDWLAPNALSLFIDRWSSLDTIIQDLLSGIIFDCVDQDSQSIGYSAPFPGLITSELNLRNCSVYSGEKVFVFKTSLLMKHLYSCDISTYVPETCAWHNIQFESPALIVSDVFRFYDQTRQVQKRRNFGKHKTKTAPGRLYEISLLLTDKRNLQYKKNKVFMAKLFVNYWRFWFHCLLSRNDRWIHKYYSPPLAITFIGLIPGLILFVWDRKFS